MAMHTYSDIHRLPEVFSRAVVINCSTKVLTLLAILSAKRYTNLPILLIDCESSDGSKKDIDRVTSSLGIDIDCVDWPLRPHPVALDELLLRLPADRVLLMDSDLEIRTATLYEMMADALEEDSEAYGSGFLHGPMWMGGEHGLPPHTGYYAERMWIPLTYLKVSTVRAALQEGYSFMNRRLHYEVPHAPSLSRTLARRYRVAGLKHIPLPWLGGTRPLIEGLAPKFVEYDTGAELHAHLLREGSRFASVPVRYWGDVAHHHGATRAKLSSNVRRLAKKLGLISKTTETEQESVQVEVLARLSTEYGVAVDPRQTP